MQTVKANHIWGNILWILLVSFYSYQVFSQVLSSKYFVASIKYHEADAIKALHLTTQH